MVHYEFALNMKKIILIINVLALILLIYSCKDKNAMPSIESEKDISNINKDSINAVQKFNYATENLIDDYIVKDSLTNAWLNSLIAISKKENLFKVEVLFDNNGHSPNVIDTIKTLKLKESKIVTYATEEFYGIDYANILTDKISLSENVKIGIQKEDFEKIIKEIIKSDTIRIGNLEQTAEFEFIFDKDSLKNIKYGGYID